MKILKFGGSSLSTPERIRGVVPIVLNARREGGVMVVVSAFGGVTDTLLRSGAELTRIDADGLVLSGGEPPKGRK